MSWRDTYRSASFRGAPFHVESAETSHGRRQAVHEHAQRDVPYTEDLGRKAREFSVSGYLLGADYHLDRDKLIEACEQAGPGLLVHPYRGELTVVCRGLSVSESSQDGGICRVSMTFLEAGEASFPRATTNNVNAIGAASSDVISAARETFVERFTASGFPAHVAQAAQDGLAAVSKFMSAPGFNFAGEMAAASDLYYSARSMVGEASGLIGAPFAMADRLIGMVGGVRAGFGLGSFGMLSSLVGRFATRFAGKTRTPSARQMAANHYATNDLVRQVAIAELSKEAVARLAAPVAAPGAPFSAAPSVQEAVAVRTQITDLIDAELENERTTDEMFTAMTALRAQVATGIPGQDSALPRALAYTPRATLPALVVAHQIYGDARRADEIASRNNPRHPGYLPGGQALEVLADG